MWTTRHTETRARTGDGKVSYKELLGHLSALMSEGEEKLRFCFDLFDADGSGSLDASEIGRVLKILESENPHGPAKGEIQLDAADDTVSRLTSVMEKLDLNGDGEVTFEEFRDGISSDAALRKMFLSGLAVGV